MALVLTIKLRVKRSQIVCPATAETLAKMVARKPDLAVLTLPNRGHAPFLDEPEALAAIDALLARAA